MIHEGPTPATDETSDPPETVERDAGTPPPLDERRETPRAKVREWVYDRTTSSRTPLGFPDRR